MPPLRAQDSYITITNNSRRPRQPVLEDLILDPVQYPIFFDGFDVQLTNINLCGPPLHLVKVSYRIQGYDFTERDDADILPERPIYDEVVLVGLAIDGRTITYCKTFNLARAYNWFRNQERMEAVVKA